MWNTRRVKHSACETLDVKPEFGKLLKFLDIEFETKTKSKAKGKAESSSIVAFWFHLLAAVERNHNQLVSILESMGSVAGAAKEKTKKLKTVRRRSTREHSQPRATKKVEEDVSYLLNDDNSEEESIATGMGSSSESDDDGTDEESNKPHFGFRFQAFLQ